MALGTALGIYDRRGVISASTPPVTRASTPRAVESTIRGAPCTYQLILDQVLTPRESWVLTRLEPLEPLISREAGSSSLHLSESSLYICVSDSDLLVRGACPPHVRVDLSDFTQTTIDETLVNRGE